MASGLKDAVTAMHNSSRRAEQLCPSSPAETLVFYLCSSPHPEELIDYAGANEEYKVKGHDESYTVPKQGASINAALKSSSTHMGASAVPEGKQSLWGSVWMKKGKSFYTVLSPVPAATTETPLSH